MFWPNVARLSGNFEHGPLNAQELREQQVALGPAARISHSGRCSMMGSYPIEGQAHPAKQISTDHFLAQQNSKAAMWRLELIFLPSLSLSCAVFSLSSSLCLVCVCVCVCSLSLSPPAFSVCVLYSPCVFFHSLSPYIFCVCAFICSIQTGR